MEACPPCTTRQPKRSGFASGSTSTPTPSAEFAEDGIDFGRTCRTPCATGTMASTQPDIPCRAAVIGGVGSAHDLEAPPTRRDLRRAAPRMAGSMRPRTCSRLLPRATSPKPRLRQRWRHRRLRRPAGRRAGGPADRWHRRRGRRAEGGSDGGGGSWIPLGIIAAAAGGGFLLYRRSKRNRERAELEPVRSALDEDVTAYGEELAELDLDVRTPGCRPRGGEAGVRARTRPVRERQDPADKVERPGQLQPVTATLDEGRWLLASVRARLAGEEPPARGCRASSTRDMARQWRTSRGRRRVASPATSRHAPRTPQRSRTASIPDVRLVPVGGGERRPYWDAGPAYGGWAGGYYGGFLPGILWGTVLGSSLTLGRGYAGGEGGYDSGDATAAKRRRIRRRRLGRRRLRRRRLRRRVRRGGGW